MTADEGQHLLHPYLQAGLALFYVYGRDLSYMGNQELPDAVQFILHLHFPAGAVVRRGVKGEKRERSALFFESVLLHKGKEAVKAGENTVLPGNGGFQNHAGQLTAG